jgi:hypothetical protein
MAEAPATRPLPTPEQLRWVLVVYGTAVFVPACMLLTLLTSGGRQMGKVFLHYLALPDPFPVAIAYGLGYLIVQYLIRNRKPSFLQSQLFAGCVYVGMFLAFAASSLVFSSGPLSRASGTAVTAVLVPLKLVLGGVSGAYLYPPVARKRFSSRYYSPTPIPPKYVARAADGQGDDADRAPAAPVARAPVSNRRRSGARAGSKARTRRR